MTQETLNQHVKCYSLRQAADLLGVSHALAYRLVREGRMAANKDDAGGYRVASDEIRRVLADRIANPPRRGRPRKEAVAS